MSYNRSCNLRVRHLLHHVRGPKGFVDLRTVEGTVCPTYHEACVRLGLLLEDACWEKTLEEAAVGSMPPLIRSLFAMMISGGEVASPYILWEKFKEFMSNDFLHQVLKTFGYLGFLTICNIIANLSGKVCQRCG